ELHRPGAERLCNWNSLWGAAIPCETSSERLGHQNGHQRVTTGRYRTERNGTCVRFSQYKSTLVGTERNGSGRPSTNFECGAFKHLATRGREESNLIWSPSCVTVRGPQTLG